MPPIPINVATEDELSELVLFKMLARINRYAVGTAYRRGGFGYLRRTIYGWNRAARGIPFIVLTDLDNYPCAPELINEWLPAGKHPNLLFRIAVREVEAWLLADANNLSHFLNVKGTFIPAQPDAVVDAKAALIRVASTSRSKAIRDSIMPKRGSTAKQGPDYNGRLGLFVRNHWDVDAAKANSESLSRTLDRLISFRPVWKSQQ